MTSNEEQNAADVTNEKGAQGGAVSRMLTLEVVGAMAHYWRSKGRDALAEGKHADLDERIHFLAWASAYLSLADFLEETLHDPHLQEWLLARQRRCAVSGDANDMQDGQAS